MNDYHVNEENSVADDELQDNEDVEVCRTCKNCIYVGLGKLDGKPVPEASFCRAYANKPSSIVFQNKDDCPYKETESED